MADVAPSAFDEGTASTVVGGRRPGAGSPQRAMALGLPVQDAAEVAEHRAAYAAAEELTVYVGALVAVAVGIGGAERALCLAKLEALPDEIAANVARLGSDPLSEVQRQGARVLEPLTELASSGWDGAAASALAATSTFRDIAGRMQSGGASPEQVRQLGGAAPYVPFLRQMLEHSTVMLRTGTPAAEADASVLARAALRLLVGRGRLGSWMPRSVASGIGAVVGEGWTQERSDEWYAAKAVKSVAPHPEPGTADRWVDHRMPSWPRATTPTARAVESTPLERLVSAALATVEAQVSVLLLAASEPGAKVLSGFREELPEFLGGAGLLASDGRGAPLAELAEPVATASGGQTTAPITDRLVTAFLSAGASRASEPGRSMAEILRRLSTRCVVLHESRGADGDLTVRQLDRAASELNSGMHALKSTYETAVSAAGAHGGAPVDAADAVRFRARSFLERTLESPSSAVAAFLGPQLTADVRAHFHTHECPVNAVNRSGGRHRATPDVGALLA